MNNSPIPGRFGISYWQLFFVLLIITAVVRFADIDSHGLTQDESTILEFTAGLVESGYPYILRGESEVPMATYELVPYFIAASIKIFGWSEASVRLPALLFSLGTLCLIFYAGRNWFDSRIALWASVLYTISPWATYWSKNCFYPSQVQFFTLLSLIFVYRVIKPSNPLTRDYYFAALSMCFTFLSWEASGLLFPIYGLLAIWLCWKKWGFLRSPHAWAALSIVGVVVIGQLARRTLLRKSYLYIGSSRAEISSPQLAITHSTFDPFYYIQKIFISEQHIILTAFLLVGILFLKSNWNLRFVFGFVFLTVLMFTELLAVQAIRYVYIVLPVFFLSAAAATFYLLDNMRGTARLRSFSTHAITVSIMALVLGIQAASLSDNALDLKEMNRDYLNTGAWELNPTTPGVDFRYVVKQLAKEYRPSDIIIAKGTFLLHLYTGLKGDYSQQEVTSSIVVYEPSRDSPFYSDKWIGNPVLHDQQEFEDVVFRHDRIWFLAAPLERSSRVSTKKFQRFIEETMELKAEAHNARLYLLDRSW